ncbi:Vitamin B12 transporter BtuB [Dyadobacter sp. CECT 9623]|uniref:Vitamin B12 transporter BtuB n=1 Tax=Dyadobacter linearis TaxID=2823330 RepID=A0ABM8USD6_9BACT|nr:SusC/RagA family TonB-linked outer membrane protein [Dyadobacter sp. CECT 9623]CAG5070477.1 Vitamin B12 transporter BtuB [Dyadobacter sp. CECT 9623]
MKPKATLKMAARCMLALLFFSGTDIPAFAIGLAKAIENGQTAVDRIKGTVTSAVDGVPVPGVNVLVKGTQTGTTTDASGNYTIDAEGSNAVLVFSYIGFNTIEMPINGKSVVDVVLEENVATLQEAVVTALGIKRETKSLGYNVGKVEAKDIANVANENVLTSLSGRVSGVSINQTSGVGSSISIIIRGAASLKNNQPLFVVDGVPLANSLANVSEKGSGNRVDYGNAISDINPDDIESMSVLKGPSAAALYGSRAGNGVILITTKSGKKGKGLGVSFSTSNVFEKPYRFLDFHYKYANGDRPFLVDESSAYWGGMPLDAGNKAPQWNSPLDENGNPVPTELKSYKNNMKNFLQTGITSTNNLTVSGSTDKSTYRVSYNNMVNRGLIPNSDLYRNALTMAGTFDMHKNLKLSTNLNFVRSNSNSRPQTSERDGNPLQAVYYSSSYDINDLKGVWKPGLEEIEQLTVAKGETDNPYFLANHLTNAYTRDRLYGNIKLDWTIAPGLTAFARYSHDMYDEDRETKIPWSYKSMAKGGYYLENIGRNESNADFLIAKAIKTPSFDVTISAGGNIMQQKGNSSNLGGRDLSVPGLYNIGNIPVGNRIVGNGSYRKAIYSLYALASVGFKNQLYLDLTARNDWSSTLPESNRSYFYPSASLSWVASTTFNMPSAISLLKFRGGWAQVGNDTDPYQLYPNLGTGNWGDLVTANLGDVLLNPTLLPEIATSTEGGIDLNMFNNRLRFDITYYDRANTNQIFSVPMAPSTGYSSKNINAGKLVSRGWEVGLGGTPISNLNGWSLDLNANFSRNRVTVKELAPNFPFFEQWGENGAGAYTYVGEQIGNLYSRGFATVTDKASPYYRWPIIAYDEKGNGDMDWQTLGGRETNVKVGNYNPDFLVGAQATLSYKRFSLGLSFDWRQGGEFMSFTYRYGESDWKSQRQIDNLIPGGLYSPDELVALLKSDPEKYIIPQNGNFPRVGGHTTATGGFGEDGDGAFIPGVWQDAKGDYHEWLGGAGTKFLPITNMYPWGFNQQVTFDASFVKLREVTLNYKIPMLFGTIRNANLSLYTRNIMLWTASQIGIDPERAFWADPQRGGFRQGIERQNVMPWTIPFGFKLNFDF